MGTTPLGEVFEVHQGQVGDEPLPLVRNGAMEVMALTVAKGQEKPTYAAPGEVLIYCIQGEVVVGQRERHSVVREGQMIHLSTQEAQSLQGLKDSRLLVISARGQEPKLSQGQAAQTRSTGKKTDAVQEASEESFPASDAPGWTPVTSP